MRFFIVHELRGVTTPDSGRMRVRAERRMTKAAAETLAGALSSLTGVDEVRANAFVGSFLIFYGSAENRVAILTLLLGAADADCRFGDAAVEEENAPNPSQGLMPLVRYVFVRPFLPWALRVFSSVAGAVPFLFKGLGALLRGSLSVDVLDAAAIGASLLMRDFRTVSMLTLLLGMGETLEQWTRRRSMATLTEVWPSMWKTSGCWWTARKCPCRWGRCARETLWSCTRAAPFPLTEK